MRNWRRVFLVAALLGASTLQSCYSFTIFRETVTLEAPGRPSKVVVEVRDVAGDGVFASEPGGAAVASVMMYPFDVVVSTFVACQAMFDRNLEVQWGPAGALLGISLPGPTLFPGVGHVPRPERSVDPKVFDELLQAIRDGKEEAVFRRIEGLWSRKTLGVKLIEVREAESPNDDG